MIKTVIAIALLTSSCSVVKATNIQTGQTSMYDKGVVYKTRVLTNREMIFINQETNKKDRVDENIESKTTFEKWKSIIKNKT